MQRMCKYFISIFFIFLFVDGYSQEQKKAIEETEKDSIVYKTPYGIRVGIDISKPILARFNDDYTGFEVVGDYRVSKNFYFAAELGYEKNTSKEDYTNSTSKGNYVRLGFNYNVYENWLDMNNEIFLGYRYGFSIFDQTLNSLTPNVNTTYFPAVKISAPITASNLNSHWSEFMFGIKVETFKNLFLSTHISYKVLMSTKEPENFKTLFSPGFNRIFESSTGFGFNYTISYLISFKKK